MIPQAIRWPLAQFLPATGRKKEREKNKTNMEKNVAACGNVQIVSSDRFSSEKKKKKKRDMMVVGTTWVQGGSKKMNWPSKKELSVVVHLRIFFSGFLILSPKNVAVVNIFHPFFFFCPSFFSRQPKRESGKEAFGAGQKVICQCPICGSLSVPLLQRESSLPWKPPSIFIPCTYMRGMANRIGRSPER